MPARQTCSRSAGFLLLLLALAFVWHGSGDLARAEIEVVTSAPRDCRYPAPEATPLSAGPEPSRTIVFPQDDLFRPLIADPKQPQFLLTYQRMRFRDLDRSMNAGFVAFGETFGLWTRRDGRCNGIQIGIHGAVFSQFNLDAPSKDLINSDFIIGFPLTWRHGPLSTRLRLYHQSSHLGDELLLSNPGIRRLNFGFEELEGLLSIDVPWVRAYGGGGYLVHREPELDRGKLQWGIELRRPDRPSPLFRNVIENLQLVPLMAVDFKAFEQLAWNLNLNAVAGVELYRPGSTRRLRFLLSYYRGFNPYGQFFNQKIELFGFGFYFHL